MIVETIKCNSYKEFYKEVFDMNCAKEKYRNFVFRGEDTSDYLLLPSALREKEIGRLLELGQILNFAGTHIDMFNHLGAEFQI